MNDEEPVWMKRCGIRTVIIEEFEDGEGHNSEHLPDRYVPTSEYLASLRNVEILENQLQEKEQILLSQGQYDKFIQGMPSLQENPPDGSDGSQEFFECLWTYVRIIRFVENPEKDPLISIRINRANGLMGKIRKIPEFFTIAGKETS